MRFSATPRVHARVTHLERPALLKGGTVVGSPTSASSASSTFVPRSCARRPRRQASACCRNSARHASAVCPVPVQLFRFSDFLSGVVAGQPYSLHVKIAQLQSTLATNLGDVRKCLGSEYPLTLVADFEEICATFPEATPQRYGFTVYDHMTTLLADVIKNTIEDEGDGVVAVLMENFSQGYLTVRCKETRIDADKTSGDADVAADDDQTESVESPLQKEVLLSPSYCFEDGSLIVYINDWLEFEKQMYDKVFIGDEFVYKMSVGGIRYEIYKEMMYFKPVADKHLKDFQNLLSCNENSELEVDFETSKEPLKESMLSSSSPYDEGVAELCYAEVFYDLYMQNLVDNLRCILRANPKVGPKLMEKLHARKIQIAPGTSVEHTTDFRRCHRSRVNSEGVLILEYMQNKYCLSNIHLIGRDLDMCVGF